MNPVHRPYLSSLRHWIALGLAFVTGVAALHASNDTKYVDSAVENFRNTATEEAFVTGEEAFLAGNEASLAKDFTAAREAYQFALQEESTAARYYNLGNTFAREKALGAALLAYERALRIDPQHAEARANRLRVREMAGLPPVPVAPPWIEAAQSLSLNSWVVILALGGWLMVAGLILWLFRRGGLTSLLVTLGALLLAASATSLFLRSAETREGLVLTNDTPLSISPIAGASPAAYAQAGEFATVEDQHEGWVFLRLDERRSGWIPAERFGLIYSDNPIPALTLDAGEDNPVIEQNEPTS